MEKKNRRLPFSLNPLQIPNVLAEAICREH
jgi:hypothetical protein